MYASAKVFTTRWLPVGYQSLEHQSFTTRESITSKRIGQDRLRTASLFQFGALFLQLRLEPRPVGVFISQGLQLVEHHGHIPRYADLVGLGAGFPQLNPVAGRVLRSSSTRPDSQSGNPIKGDAAAAVNEFHSDPVRDYRSKTGSAEP
jgi:hypothetical protein